MFNIGTWIISVIVFSSVVLGLIAILRKPGEAASQLFLFMTLSLATWQLSNFLENAVASLGTARFFLKVDFASAVFVGYFWFLFVSNFSQAKILKSRLLKASCFFVTCVLAALSCTDGIIQNIHFENGVIAFDQAHLWPLYAFVILGFFISGYVVVILNVLKSHGSLKMQNLYILIGMLISSGIALVINLFFANVLDVNLARLGIYGMIIFVFCAFYAIIRYHLFNIKIIATESFTFTLWVVLLLRIFLSDNPKDVIINSVIFGAVVLIGTLLVKSVEEEVVLQDSLRTANAGQTNLIHIMNHQIKGYLGKDKDIFAELLDGDYGDIADSARSLIQNGLAETDAGVKYVTEILRGASAENGTLPYEMRPMDLKPLIATVAEKEKEMAEKKGLHFDIHMQDGDYHMVGDATQLSEAFRNLIENSIYYTPSGSISMDLGRKGNTISFLIRDTGVGIREEDKPQVFKAGGVGRDSLKINVRSSGYGLAFTKGVIEAHKGKVWFESEGEGKGSVFFVELPAASVLSSQK